MNQENYLKHMRSDLHARKVKAFKKSQEEEFAALGAEEVEDEGTEVAEPVERPVRRWRERAKKAAGESWMTMALILVGVAALIIWSQRQQEPVAQQGGDYGS